MSTQKIFTLYIEKTSPKTSGTFRDVKVGDSLPALESYINDHYKVTNLVKDLNDEFPYFTDGGFKYTGKDDFWNYTFTCFHEDVISLPASQSKQVEGKKDWQIVKFRKKDDPNDIRELWPEGTFTGGCGVNAFLEELDKWEIFSVKRLSDNITWTIGDKFLANAGCDLTIKSFDINRLTNGARVIRVWSNEYGFWLLDQIRKAPEVKEPEYTPPPIGIIPEWLWREKRLGELRGAINRYDVAGKPRVKEWVDEVSEHGHWLHNWKHNNPESKKKEPVLFSHDNKPIYIGDSFWLACTPITTFVAKESDKGYWKHAKLFLSREEAQDYNVINTASLSVNDIHTTLIQLSQVNDRDINKYDYNEQIKKAVFNLAASKLK